jgi:hypothetical protein
VPVLVLDVDRAGHADGVGDSYRAAAAAVDRMLRATFAKLDWARDTVIVTADHGHVAPGGHGGDETEVSFVPLVLAGNGIVPGAIADDARLVDIAPTVAALLGVPAPGHAEGHALVDLLDLPTAAAARRLAIDFKRARTMTAIAQQSENAPDFALFAIVIAGLALAIGAGFVLHRRGAIAFCGVRTLTGAIAFAVMPVAMVIVTRGHLSPSYIPTLDRVQKLGAVAAVFAIALQITASWRAIRRADDRIATANGIALAGLAIALGVVGFVRAWLAPPFYDVPSPAWMVAIPTLEIAAATAGAAARPRGHGPASNAVTPRYGAPVNHFRSWRSSTTMLCPWHLVPITATEMISGRWSARPPASSVGLSLVAWHDRQLSAINSFPKFS